MAGTSEKRWRWLSRLTDLGQIVYWIGGSSIFAGLVVTISGAVSGLPFAEIATLGLLVIFAVMGIGTIAWGWWSRPRSVESHQSSHAPVGSLAEQYTVESAKRFEADARRFEEESRQTREQLEAIEIEHADLQAKLHARELLTKQTIDRWNTLFDQVFELQKEANRNYMAAYQAIVAIEDALLDKSQAAFTGLLGIKTVTTQTEAQRITDAQAVIAKYRSESLGASEPAQPQTFLSDVGRALLQAGVKPKKDS
jgi:hypothetical protein